MATQLLDRYIWIIDTLRRHKRMTRLELDAAWRKSKFSQGDPLPRRTFYSYRQAIFDIFNISIELDPSTYEYFIADDGDKNNMSDWLLNSAAISDSLSNAKEIHNKIFLEDVPSARQHLAPVIEALKENHDIVFSYLPYYRTLPTKNIRLKPLFLKIFKQRWYITGKVLSDNKIKTYALDRLSDLRVLPESSPEETDFDPVEYFQNAFGVVFTDAPVRRIALRTSPREAKYLRALPLHSSQEEIIHDQYSIFYYRMRISPDLVSEIISRGSAVTVLEPPELRLQVMDELKKTLKLYD